MIKIVNLKKSYFVNKKENVVLNNISLNLNDVGLVYILGASGSGKSTLLNILEGIDNKFEGEVYIDSKNIKKIKGNNKRKFFKNNVGIISQSSNLFEYLTVYQNLLLTCLIKGVNKSVIDEYLIKYKLDYVKNNKVSLLSGGEKQRLSLIRAIINKPKIIFSDEPTGALDKENASLLMEELYEISKSTLVIVVTHSLSIVNTFKGSVIKLCNGNISFKENLTINNNYKIIKKEEKEEDYSNLFIKESFKRNKSKNIITTISLFIGLLLIFLCFGLNEGFNSNFDNLYLNNINSNVLKIYKNDYEDINNGKLNVVKKTRPSIDNVNTFLSSFSNLNTYYNLDFYIQNKEIKINNVESKEYNLKFYFLDSNENNLYINDINKVNIESLSISINKSFTFYEPNLNIKSDEFFTFECTYYKFNIIKEFKYLNEPTIYFPYFYFLNYLENTLAKGISEKISKPVSFLDLVYLCSVDSEISSYSLYFSIDKKDIKSIRVLMNKINESNKPLYKIDSEYYFVVDSFIALMQALVLGIKMFMIVVVLCNLFLICFLTFSKLKKDKKEIAILRILGSNEEYINNIYINEGVIIYIISLSLSLLFYFLLRGLINKKLYDFFVIFNLIDISNNNFLLIISLSFVLIILSYICLLSFSKKFNIKEELKEE